MREPGLYWVRFDDNEYRNPVRSDGWTIAEWDPVSEPLLPCWWAIGSDEPCRVVEVGARVDRDLPVLRFGDCPGCRTDARRVPSAHVRRWPGVYRCVVSGQQVAGIAIEDREVDPMLRRQAEVDIVDAHR